MERELLVQNARRFAEQQASQRTTLVAAYLTGSVARSEPQLGGSSDLDIVLVDSAPPEDYEPCLALSELVHIELTYLHPREFADKRALRQHPLLAQTVFDAMRLYDPQHFFDLLQAVVRGQFDTSENVHARARNACARARQELARISAYRALPAPIPLDPDDLRALLATVEWSITAVLSLVYQSNAQRQQLRLLAAAATRLAQPSLMPLALQALGYGPPDATTLQALRAAWITLHKAAAELPPQALAPHMDASPARHAYYLRAFDALGASGDGRLALPFIERSLGASAAALLQSAEPEQAASALEHYAGFLSQTGKGSAEQLSDRIDAASRLIDAVEAVVHSWARTEGVAA